LKQGAGLAVSIGDLWRAEALLKSAMQYSPKDLPCRLQLADLYVSEARFAAARTLYLQILNENRSDITPYIGLASVAFAMDRPSEAKEWLVRAEQSVSNTTANLLPIANKYAEWQDLKKALDLATTAHSVDPNDSETAVLR